jgi:AAA+ superfamily predicted ATPase
VIDIQEQLEQLVRANYPCLCLVTAEEDRAEELLAHAGKRLGRSLYVWSMTEGWTHMGQPIEIKSQNYQILERGQKSSEKVSSEKLDPALRELFEHARSRELIVYLKDLPAFFDEPRVLRKLHDALSGPYPWTIVFSSASLELPPLLEKEIQIVEVPLPNEKELNAILMKQLRSLARDSPGKLQVPKRLISQVVQAALGMTQRQAQNVFRLACMNDGAFTEEDLDLISDMKRQTVRKSGILEYEDHDQSFRDVGGLDQLKSWLELRREAFGEAARAYGLPQPKGVFLLGVQGCGKSLVAKAVASHWHMPLLRLDVGALFSSFMGRSEENMRAAFRVAESIAPAVLWVDEIEKGFAGLGGSGNSDAGTSKRVFASFLTWMQEKTAPVFVVATANSIEHLPPELLRKGRFDEIFFVDLPTERERRQIFQIQLGRKGRQPQAYDLEGLAKIAAGLSGAEIEQAVVSAMYRAFPEGREFDSQDIASAIQATVPISRTLGEKIQELRAWANERARPATTPESN